MRYLLAALALTVLCLTAFGVGHLVWREPEPLRLCFVDETGASYADPDVPVIATCPR